MGAEATKPVVLMEVFWPPRLPVLMTSYSMEDDAAVDDSIRGGTERDLIGPATVPQCGKLRIFLSLRFYVKSILGILEV